MNDDLHRILIKGGVTSPGELKDIVTMLRAIGLAKVNFGSRQDILFPLPHSKKDQLESILEFNTEIISDRSYQNIVSSYVSADIFEMTYWLKGSTYLYILEGFDFLPKLKINITDPKQRLVPIFNGNLNFIAADSEDYWYLNVRLPHWKESAFYPVLVYSWDIHIISKQIEKIQEDIQDVEELFFVMNKNLETNNKTIEKELKIPFQTFPYYEGMNRLGTDLYWLGLYWRNNEYDLSFLNDFCDFCLDNGIGKICITPWKSFIIKGIKMDSRPDLERFLGKRGINVRHSQLEMNWHIPVDDVEALELKKFLVQSFDQNDISTYGLTFGICSEAGKRSHFASIIVEKNSLIAIETKLEVKPTYNILYFKNFDPNTQIYITYAQDIDKIELPALLMELSKKYFIQLGEEEPNDEHSKNEKEDPRRKVYQCKACLTVYDTLMGYDNENIPVGTSFENVSENYVCPVCEGPKSNFKETMLLID